MKGLNVRLKNMTEFMKEALSYEYLEELTVVRFKKIRREYEAPEKSARPTRNRFFCNAIGRTKMLFKSEAEANRFIAFNSGSYENQEYAPCRAYKCSCCDGWHITHYHHAPRRQLLLEARVANVILPSTIHSTPSRIYA